VRKLIYLTGASSDLIDILDYITHQSGSLAIAKSFVNSIREKCKHLANLSGTLGTLRSELHYDIRSFPFKNYVIFFRYKKDIFEVVSIIEVHRDIKNIISEQ
jgi:toxin ParE1/3/4